MISGNQETQDLIRPSLVRVYLSKRKLSYIFSLSGLIDLAAISPFYITMVMGIGGVDLRFIRSLRLLRLFRLLKIKRYDVAIKRLERAWGYAKEELFMFLFLAIVLIYIAGALIYYAENQAQPEQFQSIIHSLWWALATLTTVGYGDVYPITFLGRLGTFVLLMIGLGVVSAPAGVISSALTRARRDELEAAG